MCVRPRLVQKMRLRFAGGAPINLLCSTTEVLLGSHAKCDSEGAAAGAVSELFFVGQKAFTLHSHAMNSGAKTNIALLP